MTSPVAKTPKTNAEWARQVQQKLDTADNPATVRIGNWVLSEDAKTGNLLASNANGGTIVLASIPDSVETPDAKVTQLPWFRGTLTAAAGVSIPATTWTAISFDSIEGQSADAWGADKSGFQSATVPTTGVYTVRCKVCAITVGVQDVYAGISVNGIIIEAEGHYDSNATEYPIVSAQFQGRLNKGDVIAGMFYTAVTRTIGPSTLPGVAVFPTISLICTQTLGDTK